MPSSFLDETKGCLREYFQEMKPELIFRLDKVSIWERAGQKEKKVIVAKSMDDQTIHHCASRKRKHLAIITCITANGESLIPSIVISQDAKCFRRRLMDHGVRMNIHCVLRQRSKLYVNSTLFLEYIHNIFVPYLTDSRDTEELEACDAVLFMDNRSSHMVNDVTAIPIRERVRIFMFTHYMIQIWPMLDVVLFEALTNHAMGLGTLDEEQPAVAFLLKIYRAFEQTMVEINGWDTFAAIVFTRDVGQIPYGLIFGEEKFRQSLGFVEIELNLPHPPNLDHMSFVSIPSSRHFRS
jgi:hypothetical protein